MPSAAVDPPRGPFDFAKVPNGGLVEDDVSGAVVPLRSVFFISKRRSKTQGAQNRVHLLAIADASFQFNPHLVRPGFALGLVRENPRIAVLAQPEQFAFPAQLLSGQIVECVYFMRGPGDLLETGLLQRPRERPSIYHPELDFDFFRHAGGILLARDWLAGVDG